MEKGVYYHSTEEGRECTDASCRKLNIKTGSLMSNTNYVMDMYSNDKWYRTVNFGTNGIGEWASDYYFYGYPNRTVKIIIKGNVNGQYMEISASIHW
jgi:hypothetical protein